MPSLALHAKTLVQKEARKVKNRLLNLIDTPVLVLVYHRVALLDSDYHAIAVSPENFRAHLRHLKEKYNVVRFEEAWEAAARPAVAITFDDGYADNASTALPIIEEVGVPVTFFISTGNLGSQEEFWWDELERLVLGGSDYPALFQLEDREYGRTWGTASDRARKALFWDLHQAAKKVDPARRNDWLRQLRARVGGRSSRCGANVMMTHEELRLLARSKWVTIGAHTVTHPPLANLTEAEQRQEIVTSKRELEEVTEKEITVFSYPFGSSSDYDAASIRICREAGFVKAAAAFPGEAHRWCDPYQIPRHSIPDCDLSTFAAKLKSLWL